MAGIHFGKSAYLFVLATVAFGGCATEPGRTPGPGAFVAGLGGGLVRAHDNMARALLGDKAGPMIIAPRPAAHPRVEPAEAEPPRDDEATTAGGRFIGSLVGSESAGAGGGVDANGDGFVTLDEIVTLGRSGLSDAEVIDRLARTQQVFELDDKEEQYLRVRGITQDVIVRLRGLNHRPVAEPAMVAAPDAGGTPRAYDEGGTGRSTATTLSN